MKDKLKKHNINHENYELICESNDTQLKNTQKVEKRILKFGI